MRSRFLLGWLLVFCLAFFFSASTASAQAVYGSIIGTVTDPQGGAVPGAKVTVTSTTKGTADETTTNESGNYSVTHLIPDTYSFTWNPRSFKAFEAKDVSCFRRHVNPRRRAASIGRGYTDRGSQW